MTTFFANAEAFINNATAWAEELRVDRQKGQARRLVVRGFFTQLVERIGVPEVRDRLIAAVEDELEDTA